MNRMLKTIISKADEWFLPMTGAIGGSVTGGFSNWLDAYSNAIWSAVVFCVIGTVGGFILNKLLLWVYKNICKVCKNMSDEFKNKKK